MLIIDLSKEQAQGLYWTDKIQSLVIKRILDGLNYTAERFYQGDKNLNALVVIDEAHRLGLAFYQSNLVQPAPGDYLPVADNFFRFRPLNGGGIFGIEGPRRRRSKRA